MAQIKKYLFPALAVLMLLCALALITRLAYGQTQTLPSSQWTTNSSGGINLPNNVPLQALSSGGVATPLLCFNNANEILIGQCSVSNSLLLNTTGAVIGYKGYAGLVANTSDGILVNACRIQTNQTGSLTYTFDLNSAGTQNCGAVSASSGYGANWGYTVHGTLTAANSTVSATLLACLTWTQRFGAQSECTCDAAANLNCIVQAAGTATPVATTGLMVPYRFEIVADGSPPSDITLTVTSNNTALSFDNNMFIDLN